MATSAFRNCGGSLNRRDLDEAKTDLSAFLAKWSARIRA